MKQTLHVIMNHQQLAPGLLPGKVAVVLDVLFATTTIAMAMHQGVTEVITVPEVDDALAYRKADTVLAGEKDAVTPEGFESFAPIELCACGLGGKRLVLVTTNGTVALHNALGASHVYTAALVNAQAVVDHLLANHPCETILLVCAASKHRFAMEDFVGAGHLVQMLRMHAPERFALTDSALTAATLAATTDPLQVLCESRVGRLVESLKLGNNTGLAAELNRFPVVPGMRDGRLVAL